MHYARAHGLLATLAREPDFLRSLSPVSRHDIESQVAGGLAGRDNIQDILRFCGLVAKVRHNQLYEFIPLTFRVLQGLAIEIDFFTSYAPEFAKLWNKGRPLTLECRLERFIKHLRLYLDLKQQSHAFVAEVLSHELRLRDIRAACALGKREAYPSGPRVELDGTINLATMRWSPTNIETMVAATDLGTAIRRRSKGSRRYAYVGKFDSLNVDFLEVDELTAGVVSLVIRKKSIRTIAAHLGQVSGVQYSLAEATALLDGLRSFLPIRIVDV